MEWFKESISKKNKIIVNCMVVCAILCITAILFNGNFHYGMEYDEVYRINNWFSYTNPQATKISQAIYSVDVFDVSFPLMFKPYISTASIFPYLPIIWVQEPFIMLRSLYFIYTVVAVIFVYFYIKRKNLCLAIFTSLLLAVCPALYPYIRYNWSTLFYVIPFTIGLYFWDLYRDSGMRKWLMFSTFSVALGVNIQFYSLWVVAAFSIVIFLLYPKDTLAFLRELKNLIAMLTGVFWGMFNYFLYWFNSGFKSFSILYQFLFDADRYNKMPIDGKSSTLLASIPRKIDSYIDCIGVSEVTILVFLVIFGLAFAVLSFILYKDGNLSRKMFIPLATTVLAFVFMLISPNSQHAHHFTYIVATACLSLGVLYNQIYIYINKFLGAGLCILTGILFFLQSFLSITNDNQEYGRRHFSNKIYDVIHYVDSLNRINDKNLFFPEWGFAQQFYFMHKGEFDATDLTFQLMNASSEKRRSVLHNYFSGKKRLRSLYFPVYVRNLSGRLKGEELCGFSIEIDNKGDKAIKNSNHFISNVSFSPPIDELISFALEQNYICKIEKAFEEENGAIDIMLLRIDLANDESYQSMFKKQDEYLFIEGFYAYEPNTNIRWVKKKSKLYLRYMGQPYLKISYYVSDFKNRNRSGNFTILIDGLKIYQKAITQSGIYSDVIPLSNLTKGIKAIDLYFDSRVISEKEQRELSYCIEYIGFTE